MNTFEKKLHSILAHFEDVRIKINNLTEFDTPKSIALSKEFSELSIVAEKINDLFSKQQELKDLCELISNKDDLEMAKMAETEYLELKDEIPNIEHQIKVLLLPKDIDDDKGAILEIRAGTGGEE